MAFPDNWTRVPVRGVYTSNDEDGTPRQGTAVFTPSQPLLNDPTADPPVSITADPINALITDGVLTNLTGAELQLPACDDPAITQQGWNYQVRITFTGLPKHPGYAFNLFVPSAKVDDGIDLSSIVAVAGTPGFTQIVEVLNSAELANYVPTAKIGAPLGVAGLDDDGKITPSQLPDGSPLPDGVAAGTLLTGRSSTPGDATWKVPSDVITPGAIGAATASSVVVETARATAAELLLLPAAQKAAASGVASLDAATKVPVSQIPDLSVLYGKVFTPENFGGIGDGSADDTTAVNGAIAAIMTAGGGTLYLTPGKTYKCNGAIVFPYANPGPTPVQKPVRITGGGAATSNGRWASSPINGGPVLDLRYTGADALHQAKIDTRGSGWLELDHVTLFSGGTDNFPIFQTTNTTCHIHHNAFVGNLSNAGTTCVQDAIFFGGTDIVYGDGINAPFQGYGSKVHDNYFSRIRRGFVGQKSCNQISVEDNTFSTSCGSSTGGAIEFDGQGSSFCVGNTTNGNTIEVSNYKYGIAVYRTTMCTFGPDGYYDATGNHTAAIYIDDTATYNEVWDGFHVDAFQFVIDRGSATTIHTMHASQSNTILQPHRFYSVDTLAINSAGAGPSAVGIAGDRGYIVAKASTFPNSEIDLLTKAGAQVTDGVVGVGGDLRAVSSATAAWTATDAGQPITGTGIPSSTRIVAVLSATSILISNDATASGSGVTLTYGRGGGGGSATSVIQVGWNRTHYISKGTIGTPSIGSPAGTGATVTVAGTDTAWTLTLTTGTSPASGVQCTVPAGTNWTNVAKLQLTAKNAAAAGVLTNVYLTNTTSNTLLNAVAALAASTAYLFDVTAIQ